MGNLDTAIRNFVGDITGDKADLQTTDKSSLVNAINEIHQGGGASALDDLTDVTITSPANGQVLQYNGTAWVNGSVNGNVSYKIQTLTAGTTSVTFTSIPTTGNHLIDVFTSKTGLDFDSMDDSTAGTLVVTYEAQSSDVTVYLRIEDIP